MQSTIPSALLVTLLISAQLALIGMDDAELSVLGNVFKPLTTLLLFAVIGRFDTALRKKVALGLFFSLLGDIALLMPTALWFGVGLVLFAIAQGLYIWAFLPLGRWSRRVGAVAAVAISASAFTVAVCYSGASAVSLAPAVVVYAALLTTMLVSATATVGGPLKHAPRAAFGALAFYVADTVLALRVFAEIRIPHGVYITTGVYWLGQLGIAAAARRGED